MSNRIVLEVPGTVTHVEIRLTLAESAKRCAFRNSGLRCTHDDGHEGAHRIPYPSSHEPRCGVAGGFFGGTLTCELLRDHPGDHQGCKPNGDLVHWGAP